MNKSSTKKGIPSSVIKLTVFAVVCALVIGICSAVARSGGYSFVKTIYQGNGIYNAFFNGNIDADLDIPIAETDAINEIPEYVEELFGDVQYSPIACLMTTEGQVVMDKDADRQFFPASITKIMSAIITLEKIGNLEKTYLTVDQDTINYCSYQGAAVCGYKAGESVSAKDLLYGSLIASGADATITLAKHIGGSEEGFAELMNAKAEEYGLKNTHFTNSTGLHNAKHYSSAHDLAIILNHALEIEQLREIMQLRTYQTFDCSEHKTGDGLWYVSTVYKAFRNAGIDMGHIKGGKTGFTDDALLCLATFAEFEIEGENKTFILVTLGAGEGDNDTPYHVYDADAVFNKKSEK